MPIKGSGRFPTLAVRSVVHDLAHCGYLRPLFVLNRPEINSRSGKPPKPSALVLKLNIIDRFKIRESVIEKGILR